MRLMKKRWLSGFLALGFIGMGASGAEPEPATPAIKMGAFIDAYYAYDFNRPRADRINLYPAGGAPTLYSTQPARHNEFNLNLAYLEARLDAERVRGRFALQTGNSVQANYAADSAADQNRAGGAGGISRFVQEAVVGYEIAPKFWVDGGIYLSHIGLESFISRDNLTYTRSLSADNSPYYQTGLRLSYEITPKLSAQLHLINGWQTINEGNPQKALGTQVNYAPDETLVLTYNTFLGSEGGSRIFQDLVAKLALSSRWQLAASFDYGMQRAPGLDSFHDWWAATLIARYQATPTLAIVARGERYSDPKAALVAVGAEGFQAWGGSMGVDVSLTPKLQWRSELRALRAETALFSSSGAEKKSDAFAVSSLSLTI
ncbi:MAG: porin [Proteobacteria bacterium]|nr:MAG: porin [Pseudomonadota bacterium]